ncbi:MAG: hypothetical protein JW999_02250 [Methanotrichaceae archaeon]|nr:hypothetical protein [Methanotrichaceae archaeon]
MSYLESMILIGGILNIASGLAVMAKPDVFKSILKINFDPLSNPLLGYFVAGVVVAFGSGYLYTYFWAPRNLSLLALGTCVRYWLVIVSTYCYSKKIIEARLFYLIAIEALLFALAFTLYIYEMRNVLTWS